MTEPRPITVARTYAELTDGVAMRIAELNADVVATGNPGCLLQLQSSLARLGRKTRVVHTIQLLDASIRGEELWP